MATVRNILRAYSGRTLNISNPKPEQIHITDIAEGLSKECRFTGQVRPMLPVAAHSLMVWNIVRKNGGTLRDQLWALLHDAAEAYYGDMPSPLKNKCKSYKRLEEKLLGVIMKKYGLKTAMPLIVKEADDEALDIERSIYFGQFDFKAVSSTMIRDQYLEAFQHLYGQHYFGA